MDATGASSVTILFWTACVLLALSLATIVVARLFLTREESKTELEMVYVGAGMGVSYFAIVAIMSGLYVVLGIDIAGDWWLFWTALGWLFVVVGAGIGYLTVRNALDEYLRAVSRQKG